MQKQVGWKQWKALTPQEREQTKIRPLTAEQAFKLRKESEKEYATYYKEYQAQKHRHYEQGYKKGVISQYQRIYQDLDITATETANKIAQAVVVKPEKMLETKSSRFLGKQLHRLQRIQSGAYVNYWSEIYQENYVQAVKYTFGEDMAEDLRYVMDSLTEKELDKLFSDLPALNEFYNLDKQDSANDSRKKQISTAVKKALSEDEKAKILSKAEDTLGDVLDRYIKDLDEDEENPEDEE